MQERLQKIIARCGIASRRKAEEFIKAGRVTIDGERVTRLGVCADLKQNRIEVDGNRISEADEKVYILLYKPRGYITSLEDPQNRPKVTDLLENIPIRVFPVGRLDYNSEGLLLLTNDGSLAQKLLHPRFAVPRTYLVKVKGIPDASALKSIQTGVNLADGMTSPAKLTSLGRTRSNSWHKITVKEGRNQLIKRMFQAVGHPVSRLIRIKFGPFDLEDLRPGDYRFIAPEQVNKLIRS